MINPEVILSGALMRLDRLEFSVECRMLQLRLWQHLLNHLLKQKTFRVPVHLGFGSEALVSGLDEVFSCGDEFVLTHRNAVYNMARASSLHEVIAEYRGDVRGIGKGRLGSMNLVNPLAGIIYSSSILGNNFSVACGLAFARVLREAEGVVCVVTGDGAMEEGSFYEALVFSKSHRLPLLFVVDNNDHSMVSSISDRRCPIDIGKLCSAVGIPFAFLSGNDVSDYVKQLRVLRRGMLDAPGPVCIEVETSLLNQHAGPTPGWPTDPMRLELREDWVVTESSKDPIAVLKTNMGEEAFMQCVRSILDSDRL